MPFSSALGTAPGRVRGENEAPRLALFPSMTGRAFIIWSILPVFGSKRRLLVPTRPPGVTPHGRSTRRTGRGWSQSPIFAVFYGSNCPLHCWKAPKPSFGSFRRTTSLFGQRSKPPVPQKLNDYRHLRGPMLLHAFLAVLRRWHLLAAEQASGVACRLL